MRKVFLDDLPRYYKGIDWKNCIGYKVPFIYEDIEGEVKIIDYQNGEITLVYKNSEYKILRNHFIKCCIGRVLGKRTKEFKLDVNQQIKDDKRDLIIIDRFIINSSKRYKYHCNKCGNEDWIIESHIIGNKSGCNVCANQKVVEGINDIPTTAPWMVKYFQGGYDEAKLYTKCSTKKVKMVCPNCGTITKKPIIIGNLYKTKSISCWCSDKMTIPNKFIRKLIEQLKNIYSIQDYNFEYNPTWAKRYRYDAYIKFNNIDYVIEMDGGRGHGKSKYKTQDDIETELKIDAEKNILAENNKHKMIRIDCNYRSCDDSFQLIKSNIKNSLLAELFDLSQVNWIKLEEDMCKNIIREICDIKNKYNFLSSYEIGSLIKMSGSNVKNALKKGAKLGWCNYDPKEERQRGRIKSRVLSENEIKNIIRR